MPRRLLAQKAFFLVDFALIVLLALVTYLSFADLSKRATPIEASLHSRCNAKLHVASVGAENEYRVIQENGLFGSAAKERGPGSPQSHGNQSNMARTLPLKLLGTATTAPTDPLSSAGIKNTQTNLETTYYIGEPVLPDLILKEVRKREVVLFNTQDNKPHTLRMAEQ